MEKSGTTRQATGDTTRRMRIARLSVTFTNKWPVLLICRMLVNVWW